MAYNRNDPAQLQALKDELAKPAYSTKAGEVGDQGLADMLNKLDATIKVSRGVRPSVEVMSAITGSEFVALSAGARDYLIALVSPGSVDLSNDVVRTSLQAGFPVGSASRTALLAIADKTPASRSEQLFGIGTTITANDVAYALRG